jgi:hypothetical protein
MTELKMNYTLKRINSKLDRCLQSSVSGPVSYLTGHKMEILETYNTIKNLKVYWKDIEDLHSNLLDWVGSFPLVGTDAVQEIKTKLQSNDYSLNEGQTVITWQLTINGKQFKSRYEKKDAEYCTGVRTVKGLYHRLTWMLLHAWDDEDTICIAMLFVNTLICSSKLKKSVLRIIKIQETPNDCLVSFTRKRFHTNFSTQAAKLNEILLYLWGLMNNECTEHHLFEFARAILEPGIPDPSTHHFLTWIIFDNPQLVFKSIDGINKTELADMLTSHLDSDINQAAPALPGGSVLNSKRSFRLHFKTHGACAMFCLANAFDRVTIRTVGSVPVLDYTRIHPRDGSTGMTCIFYPHEYYEGGIQYTTPVSEDIQQNTVGFYSTNTINTYLQNTARLYRPDTHFSEIGYAFRIVLHLCPQGLPRRFQDDDEEPASREFDDEYRFSSYTLDHMADTPDAFVKTLITLGSSLYHYTPSETGNDMEYNLDLHYNGRSLIPGNQIGPVATDHLFHFYFKGLALADEMIIMRSFESDDARSVASSADEMDVDHP